MTEYIIIVVLVAIAVLAAVKLFGEAVSERFEGAKDSVQEMGGKGTRGRSQGASGGMPIGNQSQADVEEDWYNGWYD